MGKRQEEPPMEGAPAWITTFVDMISLLVTFFILLYTFSSMDEYSRFNFPQNLLGSRGTIEDPNGSAAVKAPESDVMSAMHPDRGALSPHTRSPDALDQNSEEMGQKASDKDIEFAPQDARDGLVLHFEEGASFRPGDATVNATLRKSLVQLSEVMQHYPNLLLIEGHADSEFKPSSRYPTPEALSCARAIAAAQVILSSSDLSPKQLQVAGLGSSRPLNNNATARERTANRRVEIRISPTDEAQLDSARGQRD